MHLMLDRRAAPEDGIVRTVAVVVREADGQVISVHQGFAKHPVTE
jgi:hypothetical protein